MFSVPQSVGSVCNLPFGISNNHQQNRFFATHPMGAANEKINIRNGHIVQFLQLRAQTFLHLILGLVPESCPQGARSVR